MAAARERSIALYAYNTRADAEANTNGTEYTSGIVDDTPRYEHVFFTEFPGWGEANAAMFSCDISGTADLSDKWVRVKYSYYATDAATTMTDKWLFLGRVDSCKYDTLKTVRTLVAYDLLYWLRSVDISEYWAHYWSNEDRNRSIAAFLSNMSADIGVTLGNIGATMLPTSTITAAGAKETTLSGCSFVDVLAFIGQLCRVYFFIGGDGKLNCARTSNAETPVPVDTLIDTQNTEIGDGALPAYTAMMAYSGADVIYSTGSGEPLYTIRDNPLLNGKTTAEITTQLNALFSELDNVTGFWPGEFEYIVSSPEEFGNVATGAVTYTPNLSTQDGNETRLHAAAAVECWGVQLINQRVTCPTAMTTGGAVSASMSAALNAIQQMGVEMTYKVNSDNVIEAVNLEAQGGVTINAQAININGVVSANGNFKVDTQGNMKAANGEFSGDIVSGNFTANGKVRIVPDYTAQTAGQYAIELIDPTTGYATQLNPDHANIGVDPNTGVGVHLSRTDVTLSSGTNETASNYTRVRMENAGAGATGLRISEGGIGTSGYKDIYIAPGEITRTGQTDVVRMSGSHVRAYEYSAAQNKTWYGDFSDVGVKFGSGSGDLRNGNPAIFSTMLSDTALTVGGKDILRTHMSLVGGWGTAIPANTDLNTVAYLAVGRYFCGVSATAASLSNCPVSDAFCMTVEAPINETIDNESTATWQYRLRTIYRYNGEIYRQFCNSGSTAGSFTYNAWVKIATVTERTLHSLIGNVGVQIPANANLNITTYASVGSYYQGSSATVRTFSNCPTTEAFTMECYNVTKDTIGISDSNWTYMVRKITDILGRQWVQTVRNESAVRYGEWMYVLTDTPSTYTRTTITSVTDTNLSLVANFTGNWYRRSGNVVEINLSIGGADAGWRTVTTLPEAYRPPADRYFSVLTLAFGVGAVFVSTAGLVRVRTGTGTGTVGGCITYIV